MLKLNWSIFMNNERVSVPYNQLAAKSNLRMLLFSHILEFYSQFVSL